MKPIIKVENLGKRYEIGLKAEPYSTVRESLVNAARRPLNAFKSKKKNGNDQFWALKDINFEVMPGEVVGIIGRNGAGKSTLLKVLSRITEPTTGRVELYGRVGSLLEVGTGFHPELTGRENIYLNGAILGMRREEIAKKFDEIVDFSEIEEFLDTPVKRYSSGMYVRLAFAVAAHLEPEILVVDEVLAVGDASFQKKCLGKMREISEGGGRTVFFVSHNLAAVKQLCTKSILLIGGKLDFMGPTMEVLERYQSKDEISDANRTGVQNRDVAFEYWNLRDQKGEQQYSCYTRQACEFELGLFTKVLLKQCEIGFILRDGNDDIIFSVNTRDFGGDFLSIGPGKYLFMFGSRLPLRAGLYTVDVGIADNGLILDHWTSNRQLRVLDDYTGVLEERWRGILNEKFTFTYRELPAISK